MKKNFLLAVVFWGIISALFMSGCTKHNSPASAEISSPAQQTATQVAAAQYTAIVELTGTAIEAAIIGTATPTVNKTATKVAAISTMQVAVTLTYIASAGSIVQAEATSTAAAQKTAKAQQTVFVVTPSITETPSLTYTPTQRPTATQVGTLPAMPLSINASIYIDDYGSGPSGSVYIQVTDANYIAVPNADVKFKNITKGTNAVSLSYDVSNYYGYQIYYNDFNVQGNTLEVDVYYNGVTYTAQGIVPEAQINSDGSIISWQNSASGNVYVSDPLGNNIYSQTTQGNSVNISSVYSLSGLFGEYQADLSISNSSNFTGGSLGNKQMYISYYAGWTVEILPGTRTLLPTPTPYPPITNITINAMLSECDLEGGLSQMNYVMVYDMNENEITNAGVIFKNLSNASQVNAVYNSSDSQYKPVSDITYIPGNIYEVDVSVDGVVYTAQATAPIASGYLSADCDTLSWDTNGNFNMMSLYSNMSYFNQNLTGNSMDISSLYNQDGNYSLSLTFYNAYSNGSGIYGIPTRPGVFAGASARSFFAVGYQVAWDIEVVTP